MINLSFTIKGQPVTKKNHSNIYINKNSGKRFVSPSEQYKKYKKEFYYEAFQQKLLHKNIDSPVNIKCVFYMKTKRKVDLTNLLSCVMDCLCDESINIIADDDCTIAVSNDGSCVKYDKNNPRVEIEITSTEPTFVVWVGVEGF